MNSDNRYFLCNSVHSAGNSACCGFVWSLSQDSADALNSKLQEEIEKLQEDIVYVGSGPAANIVKYFDVASSAPPTLYQHGGGNKSCVSNCDIVGARWQI